MKKTIFCLLLLLCAYQASAVAQPLPMDSSVHKGTLPNGLTYYIAHNAQTPHVADFYIAQRVGSILEEPRQRGLAHFLEHMAFNGSRHFPGGDSTIVKWCESIGVKFGANLNAYTSVDQTVYNISAVPTLREGVIDSCLLILSDWSHDLSLSDKEIDKERGVVREEWRTRRSGMAIQRLMEDAVPVIYAGSKYADCLPIGNIDIINHFPYQDLRDYYRKWYRPDLQAIIVVGDIDVKAVEAKVKRVFGTIPAKTDAEPRVYYPVPDNKKMIVFTATDKEQPTVNFSFYMKREATPRVQRNTLEEYKSGYISDIICSMLNDRLQNVVQKPNPPFISASVRDGDFYVASTKSAFSGNGICNPDSVLLSIKAFMAEVERARQHGFTMNEMERAKKEWIRRVRIDYEERNNRRNASIVGSCVSNFTSGEPLLSPDEEMNIATNINATVGLQEVNKAVKDIITDANQVVTIYGPAKNGFKMPSHNDIEHTILTAQADTYAPYTEKLLPHTLVDHKPEAGSIVSEQADKFGYTRLLLSNGMKVYVRNTDFETDDISMRVFSKGGRSLYGVEDMPNLSYAAAVVAASGLDTLSADDIDKMLAGRTVSVTPYIASEEEGMKGSCVNADLETMLQLTWLYFTRPRRDEAAFKSIINRQRLFLANRDANPMVAYRDSITAILYGNNPRLAPITKESLNKVNLDRIMQIYRERFADASDFDVVFTGNINIDSLRPLLCTYLASLPANHSSEQARDNGVRIRPVKETHVMVKKQEVPSSVTSIYLSAPFTYNVDNDLRLDVLGQLLRMDYTEKIREEQGGTYGVSVSADLSDFPVQEAVMSIRFRTDPTQYARLIPLVYQVLKDMAEKGPDVKNLDKVKEYETKTYGQVKIMNDYWETMIHDYLMHDIDFDSNYLGRVKALTVDDIRSTAKKLLASGHRIEVTMSSSAQH